MSDKRVSLGKFLALGERLNAKNNPITNNQLDRFAIHPHGSVSELCVEVKRLPKSYGIDDVCVGVSSGTSGVSHLTITPNGNPCMVTVANGMNTVVCGMERFDLLPHLSTYILSRYKVRLLGFSPDGKPVTVVKGSSTEDASKTFYAIFRGSEKVLESGLPFEEPTLLENGDVVYWKGDEKHEKYLMRNDSILGTHFLWANKDFSHEIEKDLWAWRGFGNAGWGFFIGTAHRRYINRFPKGICGVIKTKYGHQFYQDQQLYLVVGDWLTEDPQAMPTIQQNGKPFGNNRYLSDFIELPDGRIAYIGETTRDKLQCIVIDSEEQASFEKVSPLFEVDGVWRYYGLIGRHLYTMEIPQAE